MRARASAASRFFSIAFGLELFMAEPSKHVSALGVAIKRIIPRVHASIVLLLAARLEESLSQIIQGNMPNLTNNKKPELFDGYGPLNNFGSKIEIAYALGFILAEERRNLQAIKCIRNVFAHSSDSDMSIDHPSLAKALAMLPTPRVKKTDNLVHFKEVCQICSKALDKHLETINLVKALKDRVDSKKASTGK